MSDVLSGGVADHRSAFLQREAGLSLLIGCFFSKRPRDRTLTASSLKDRRQESSY